MRLKILQRAAGLFPGISRHDQWLLLSCLFSLLLLGARVIASGEWLFIFLPWNLFLAAVPFFISRMVSQRPGWIENKWIFSLLFILWLLFIPNSFYILTDLFHLEVREKSSLWFDLVLIFSFAWNGLLLGILSVNRMERIMLYGYRIRHPFLFLLPVMWLIAFGVYIGRFLRFNSWDVIANPFRLIGDIGYMLLNPFDHMYLWGMITCFALFMTIIYLSVKEAGKNLLSKD